MDIEQTDATDIGVDEHISEIFNGQVSLANPATTIVEQENALESENGQEKASEEGHCHIFNYQDFFYQPNRKGSEEDVARLKHDFTQLNLNVHLHENLTYEETFNILNEASRKTYSKHDSKYFICCFLTHGSQNILWAKDRKMNIDDILLKFSESSSLKETPKIFIIQACRGQEPEEGVSTESTDCGFLTDTEHYLDFLIANSTYLDTFSFRGKIEEKEKYFGSFFIDEFCRSLEQFSSVFDLVQILTIVNYRMANIFLSHNKSPEKDKKKQMPCFVSTLRKKVEFNKEIEPFVSSNTEYFNKRREESRYDHDSIDYFTRNSNLYSIKKSERVLYLAIVNKEGIEKVSLDVPRAIDLLWGTFANKDYSREHFQKKFKRSKILEFLNQSNQAKGTSEVDCLICFIAAYSRYDSVCDADGRKMSKKEIVEKFTGQTNKSFVGIPKIFIFLLCKVKETTCGEKFCEDVEPAIELNINTNSSVFEPLVSVQEISSSGRKFNSGSESTDGGCIRGNLIPVHADILEIGITVTDWKQVIGPIALFSKILKEKSKSTDLLSLLTEFNCELVDKHNFFGVPRKISGTDSSFSVTSTLTKLLYLP